MQQNDFVVVQIVGHRHERRERGRSRQDEPPNARVSQQLIGQLAVIIRAVINSVDQVFVRQQNTAFFNWIRIRGAHARVWTVFYPIFGGNAPHECGGTGFKLVVRNERVQHGV